MMSKALSYYQMELQERAKAAKWEKRFAALSTLVLLTCFAATVFLLIKNRQFFAVF